MKRLIFIILLFFSFSLTAQEYTNNQLKSAIIFKILENVFWQNDDSLKQIKVFFYGENNDLLNEIKNLEYLTVRDKSIKVSSSQGFFEIPVDTPNVIIISKSRNSELEDIFKKIKGKNILLITNNAPNKDITMINLLDNENVVTFEVNKKNIDSQHLEITPKLLILGGQIDEVRNLYKEQEKKLEQVRQDIKQLQQNLYKKQQEITKQQQHIDSQIVMINRQKSQIDSQNAEISNQQIEIYKQNQYLLNLYNNIKSKNDTLQAKTLQLAEQKKHLEDQQKKLKNQTAQLAKSQKLYDSISTEIIRSKNILEKQKGLIELQKRGLLTFTIILFLILILVYVIYKNYRNKKKINDELRQKNILINEQNEELKEQSETLKEQADELKAQAETLAKINAELEKLSIVASRTDNSVIIILPDGTVEWVNESFIKFYGKELYTEIFNKKIKICDFKQINDLEKIMNDYLKKGKSYNFVEKYQSEEKTIWIQTSLTPTFTNDNKINRIIAIDTNITEIKKTQEILFHQNKEIKQSITYASRIQNALLPQKTNIITFLKDYFILFRPRDIVSGDFYWITQKRGKIIFTAADCTGHGVPGAFMSMLGISLLKSITTQILERHGEQFLTPAFVLSRLKKMIIRILHQENASFSDSKDGMDMALCIYEPKKKILTFAGANNPLYLIRRKELQKPSLDEKVMRIKDNTDFSLYEIKADKIPVGISPKKDKKFTNKEISIFEGDQIYIFSDGFPDQFGGPDNRKFMSGNFKKLLLSIAHLDMEKQKQELEKKLDYWLSFRKDKKHNGQTDDILVWGIRF